MKTILIVQNAFSIVVVAKSWKYAERVHSGAAALFDAGVVGGQFFLCYYCLDGGGLRARSPLL